MLYSRRISSGTDSPRDCFRPRASWTIRGAQAELASMNPQRSRGEPLRYLAHHQHLAGADGGQLEPVEQADGGIVHRRRHLDPFGIGGADVDGDGQVESTRLVVDRIEVGIRDHAPAFDGPHGDPYRSVLRGPADLLDGGVDVRQWRHTTPAERPAPWRQMSAAQRFQLLQIATSTSGASVTCSVKIVCRRTWTSTSSWSM